MKLTALAILTYIIVWALACMLHNFISENWQALSATTRWLLTEAAPRIGAFLLIVIMVLSFMVAMGDS